MTTLASAVARPNRARIADRSRSRLSAGKDAETGADAGVASAAGEEGSAVGGFTDVATQVLVAPEVAFVLTVAGLTVLAVWIALPHLWWTGLSAIPTLGLGILGLWQLPLGIAAAILLIGGAASLAMEVLFLPGRLLHASGGAVALTLTGLCLEHPWSGAHPLVVVPTAALAGLVTWRAARGSWHAVRTEPLTPSERLVGRDLVVLDSGDGTYGHAVVAGQLWTIHDPAARLQGGCRAKVTARDGDSLIVRRARLCHRPSDTI